MSTPDTKVPAAPTNPVQAQAQREMLQRTNALKEGFEIIDKANLPTVPEFIFVRDFLPLFSGQNDANKAELLQAWNLISGTPYIPVNVVDTRGSTIIQVPPLLDRTSLVPTMGNKMGNIFSEANQRSHMSPIMADRIISQELDQKLNGNMERTPNPVLEEQWKKLFEHYGVQAATAGKPTSAKADDNDSDFEMI